MHYGYKQLKNLRPWSNSVACGIEWEMSPNTSYPDCTTPLLEYPLVYAFRSYVRSQVDRGNTREVATTGMTGYSGYVIN